MSIFFTKTSIGYSHVTANKRCQDFSASYHDEERSIVTACDGHGGNVYIRSHLGAKFASNAVIDVLREIEKTAFHKAKKEAVIENIRLNILCRWNALVEGHLAKNPIRMSEVTGLTEAEILSLRKNPIKAYGTTLNAAMILGTKLICVSIGDGGCFLVKSGVVIPAFTEDEDDPVANITYSLCQDDAFSHLSVSVHELSAYDGAVVCTDGMINPYQNLSNFSSGLIAPAIATLNAGKSKSLEAFVSEVGARLGTGDDVSLGIVVKDKLSSRIYKHTKTI
jgi:serine/threonine protein phosphatase PrpC